MQHQFSAVVLLGILVSGALCNDRFWSFRRFNQFGLRGTQGQSQRTTPKQLYLIPRSTQSCLGAHITPTVTIGSDMTLLDQSGDKVLKFPGCFDLKATMEVQDNPKLAYWRDAKFIAHQKWEWLQAGGSNGVIPGNLTSLSCHNQDSWGCNGAGNDCYYCDLCNEINKYNEKHDNKIKTCPKEEGIYEWETRRCVNDWGDLDKDGNGKADFLESDDWPEVENFLRLMEVQGYGTIRLQLRIGLSESPVGPQASEFQKDKDASGSRWPQVYAKKWLPKLVNDNLVACVNVFFDVCDKPPSFKSAGNKKIIGSTGFIC